MAGPNSRLAAGGLLALVLLAVAPAPEASHPPDMPVAHFATLEWPPYIGEHLPGKGYVHELIQAALAGSGYTPRFTFHPWSTALELARAGEVAAIVPEYYDPARVADFAYSQPFPGGPVFLCTRSDRAPPLPPTLATDPAAALQELRALRFGVVRGYLNLPAFDEATYLAKREASSDLANLRALLAGHVDLVLIDRRVAAHLLAGPLRREAARVACPQLLAEQPLYVAFARKAPGYGELLLAFNRGLDRLQRAGAIERLLAKHGLRDPAP